jgi:hypothetical protein
MPLIYEDSIDDSVGVARSTLERFAYGKTASDQLKFDVGNSFLIAIRARTATATAGVGLDPDTAQQYLLTKTASDEAKISDVMSALGYFSPTVADLIRVASSLSIAELAEASDTVGIAPLATAAQALAVIESLGLSGAVLGASIQGLTVAETVRLLDGLFNFFSANVNETVGIDPAFVATKLAVALAQAGVGIDPTVSRVLVLRIDAVDGVDIEDIDLEKMFFEPTLADLIQISAAYIAPNDVFTIWNVNAVTGAVSQYDNYAFNSFANFGQMYIGADEDGLYELNGCNDEGSAIIARIKSGLAQLTESRFTMIRDAYIGMRSDGTFVLRITTGEKEVYDYTFDNQNMKTTRVQLGKGMRTRYASFELISTGSDFDLDSVEFIPLSSARRV